MLHITLNISCFLEKTFEISAFLLREETTRGNWKIKIKKEGISHLAMHLLGTSYTYKPVWEKKKELIHADTQKSDN